MNHRTRMRRQAAVREQQKAEKKAARDQAKREKATKRDQDKARKASREQAQRRAKAAEKRGKDKAQADKKARQTMQQAAKKAGEWHEDRPANLAAAIAGLNPDDPAHWTADGKPDARVLSELLGREVTAAERDDYLATHQGKSNAK